MSGRRGHSDKTKNIKEFRLVITWPGRKPQVFTTRDRKRLRSVLTQNLDQGARIEMQEHAGFGVFTTTKRYEPQRGRAKA
ncbi:hypothetical protein [Actinacidiphila acididurans]|uniref:Uncharacterized protein n=1 Tax=Actinacidiphila acididurans TaxID=2784346 RepID=A0ABS2U794_9ACTN|nr:hypothetical protein [Actinacidiphila acididurans]MBM9510038.1 hypothetical protein [Actinacidiphila acididurans]